MCENKYYKWLSNSFFLFRSAGRDFSNQGTLSKSLKGYQFYCSKSVLLSTVIQMTLGLAEQLQYGEDRGCSLWLDGWRELRS